MLLKMLKVKNVSVPINIPCHAYILNTQRLNSLSKCRYANIKTRIKNVFMT